MKAAESKNNQKTDGLPNPEACRTCMFRAAAGEEDIQDRANTDTCAMYAAPEYKPEDVYWHGAKCEKYAAADDRPQALLLGLAVGDALGVPVEFMERGTFHVTTMTGYGTWDQPPGTWSDDTSLALALADSMHPGGVDLAGMARRFIGWYTRGEYTANGWFDAGNTTKRSILRLLEGVEPARAGGTREGDNGNGALMRIAPLVFYLSGKAAPERYQITRDVASVTHGHPLSATACFIYLEMLDLLLKGRNKEAAYAELKEKFEEYAFLDTSVLPGFERILKGDVAALPEKAIRSGFFVVDTLEAAFWSFLTTTDYRGAVLRAVNLGDDTDTTGAVTGALAGLYYGLKSIPQEWLDTLVKREEIRDIAIRMPKWGVFGK